jgi:hypothetical protein
MSRFFFKNPEFPLNALILKDIVDLFFMAEFQTRTVIRLFIFAPEGRGYHALTH